MRLAGDAVVLRTLELSDIDRIVEIQGDRSVARWWGDPDRADIERKVRGDDESTGLAIEVGGEVVGMIEFYEQDEPDFRHAGIDLFLAPSAQGRGLGPDAARTLARHLVDARGHHRIVIDPAAANLAAIRAYEKVGFKRVGLMREYWRDQRGVWQDGLLMDLLASELG